MHYLTSIKDCEDLRVPNRQAFKMEQVYKFNLDKYIQYYDYDQCDEKSDDEYSPENDGEDDNNNFQAEIGPGTGDIDVPGEKIRLEHSKPSIKIAKLNKTINSCLDGFSEKMAKTKSLHSKLNPQRKLISSKKLET